ncbi:MAG: hypothetical protein VW124_26160, partial [Paracoccaceae bacterium]
FLRNSRMIRHLKLPILISLYYSNNEWAHQFFKKEKFDCCIFPETNFEYRTDILIKIARINGISTIVLPYTMAGIEELVRAYETYKPYQVKKLSIISFFLIFFPQWKMKIGKKAILPCDINVVFAKELFGLRPKNPWLINSFPVDCFLTESGGMHGFYKKNGLQQPNMIMTGSLVDDEIFRASPANKKKQATKTILWAIPPDQTSAGRQIDGNMSYFEIISAIALFLREQPDTEIIATPHPRINLEKNLWLKDLGVNLSTQDTASLIPLADIFIATSSATIRWAIASSKPVINFDFYRYNYADFKKVSSVIEVKSLFDFRQEYKNNFSKIVNFRTLQKYANQEAPIWGFRDGKSGKRIQNAISASISSKKVFRKHI